MESSINRVELLGRTGNRPTLKQTPNGTPRTQFSLYTNQLWRNSSGELCEAAERHAVTAWGQLAIQCCNHLHKGSRVYVSGRLPTRRWEDGDTGETRLRTEIIASEVIFLGGIQQSTLPPDHFIPERDGVPLNTDEDTLHGGDDDALSSE